MASMEESLQDIGPESQLEEQLSAVKRDNTKLKSQLNSAWAEVADLRKVAEFADSMQNARPKPPKWLVPKQTKGKHKAILCSILSDCHFDEVVRPEEVGFQNAYDRSIATTRLQRYAEGLIVQSRDYLAGLEYEGAVICLGGDIFSGNIHDELKETNEDTPFGSMLYWLEQICAALTMLADHFGKVYVPVVVGNHGRMTKKSRAKLRARDNLDWLLGHLVAHHFKDDPRVTVEVNDDADAFFTVYDTVHLLTHGDQVTGGGGIGGIWPPLMRMIARKQVRYNSTPFDVMVCGHWHQLIMAPAQGLIVNGSTKGYDEYAAVSNFRPERAQQAMWIVTPENKITWTTGIFCDDRASEGW